MHDSWVPERLADGFARTSQLRGGIQRLPGSETHKLGHTASTGDRFLWGPEVQQQLRLVVEQGGEVVKEEVHRAVKVRTYPGYPLVVDVSSRHYYEEWHFQPGMVRDTQENENI